MSDLRKLYDTLSQINEWDEQVEEGSGVREITNKLIEAVEEGILDWEDIARASLNYMSEADVADMAERNELVYFEDEDEDEEDDTDWQDHPGGTWGLR
jgi:hypothetical protein